MTTVQFIQGDTLTELKRMDSACVDTSITSPPYWGLRDYGVAGQLGLEPSLDQHIAALVEICGEIGRILKPGGTLWLNYGDCYATQSNGRSAADTKAAGKDNRTFRDKPFDTAKAANLASGNLCLIPERLALALQADGWIVRARIIWGKRNTKPDSSGRWRPSYNHEMIWMLARSMPCFYDAVAVRQPAASKPRRDQTGDQDTRLLRAYEAAETVVWDMATASFREAHFATFPPELVRRCIMAGCPEGGTVLDPFAGAGTTALVAREMGRSSIGIDLNPEYITIAQRRLLLPVTPRPRPALPIDILNMLGFDTSIDALLS